MDHLSPLDTTPGWIDQLDNLYSRGFILSLVSVKQCAGHSLCVVAKKRKIFVTGVQNDRQQFVKGSHSYYFHFSISVPYIC